MTEHPRSYSSLVYTNLKPPIRVGSWVVVQDLEDVLAPVTLGLVVGGPTYETAAPLGKLTTVGETWLLQSDLTARAEALHPVDLEDIAHLARTAAARRQAFKPLPNVETQERILRAQRLAMAFIERENVADEGVAAILFALCRAALDLAEAELRVRDTQRWCRNAAACLRMAGALELARSWCGGPPPTCPHPRVDLIP